MEVPARKKTLGGETRDSSPEMVGGSWEGGFTEERSKCTALRSVCAVMRAHCAALAKEAL